ncbi:MAG: hypothetical protein JW751_25740 [Polyangiaceae bacterium]|nr:hypothetical protein [Polyangiaceae bacterium]
MVNDDPTILRLSWPSKPNHVELPADIEVYADEQGTNRAAKDGQFAVGFVYSAVPLADWLVTEALGQRRQSDDHRCVRRPYFRASEDCPNCRETLANAIQRQGPLFFDSIRWNHARSSAWHPKGGTLHQHATTLALGHLAFHRRSRSVTLLFNRTAGLSEEAWPKWLQEEHRVQLNEMVRLNGPTMCFPVCRAVEVGSRSFVTAEISRS